MNLADKERELAVKRFHWTRWNQTRLVGEYITFDELFLPKVSEQMTKDEFERAMR